MNSRIKSCFISAPAGANLSVLRDVLDKNNVRVIVPEDLPIGSAWSTEISSILSEVDLVIGVLTRARKSDSVLFELGMAWALGRQIILFTPPKFTALQFELRHFLVIRSGLQNREAISFAIGQLIAAPAPEKKAPSPKRSETYSLGKRVDILLREVDDAIAARQGQKLEEIVTSVIRQSGVDIVSEAPNRNESADLAIWSDALQPLVSNPFLVEIKLQIRGSEDAHHAARQLSKAISLSGAFWGLLLYGEGPENKSVWKSLPHNVLAMSLPTLIKQMEHRSFVDVIREQCNLRMHGEYPY